MANIEYKKRRLSSEQIAELSAQPSVSPAIRIPGTLLLNRTVRKPKARVDHVVAQKPKSPFANLRNMLTSAIS